MQFGTFGSTSTDTIHERTVLLLSVGGCCCGDAVRTVSVSACRDKCLWGRACFPDLDSDDDEAIFTMPTWRLDVRFEGDLVASLELPHSCQKNERELVKMQI